MTIKKILLGVSTLVTMLPMSSMAGVTTTCGTGADGHSKYTCSGSSWGCNRFYKTVLTIGGQNSNTSLDYLGDHATHSAVIELDGKVYEVANYDVHFKQHDGKQYILVSKGGQNVLKKDMKWNDVYISGNNIRGGRMPYQDFVKTSKAVPIDVLRVLDSKN
jgi:hypothetical protein